MREIVLGEDPMWGEIRSEKGNCLRNRLGSKIVLRGEIVEREKYCWKESVLGSLEHINGPVKRAIWNIGSQAPTLAHPPLLTLPHQAGLLKRRGGDECQGEFLIECQDD